MNFICHWLGDWKPTDIAKRAGLSDDGSFLFLGEKSGARF
jgi:hypothetical protein